MFLITDKPYTFVYDLDYVGLTYNKNVVGVNFQEYLTKKCKSKKQVFRNVVIKYKKEFTPNFILSNFYYNSNTNVIQVYFKVLPHVRTIKPFKDIFKFNIPMISFSITQYKVENSSHIQLYNLEQEDSVWYYGNVYKGGDICWGGVQVITIFDMIKAVYPFSEDSQQQYDFYINNYLQYIYTLFFNSNFNRDLQGESFLSILQLDTETKNVLRKILATKYRGTDELIDKRKLLIDIFGNKKPQKLLREIFTEIDLYNFEEE